MKLLTILAVLLAASPLFAQYEFDDSGKIIFQETVYLGTSATPEEIQERSQEWMLSTFYNAGSISGESILTRGTKTIDAKRGARVIRIDLEFTLLIEHKKGKARITFSNIVFKQDMLGQGENKSDQPAEELLLSDKGARWVKEIQQKTIQTFEDYKEGFKWFHKQYKPQEISDDW